MSRPTLYVDLDGVLADFDRLAGELLGTDNSYKWEWVHGAKAFWEILNAHPHFFYSLPMMEDARWFWSNISHLNPVILTALPREDAADVDAQKRAWVAENLGPEVKVITCLTSEKPDYCRPGDVLVDDRTVNAEKWGEKGGVFIHHTSAYSSLPHINSIFSPQETYA